MLLVTSAGALVAAQQGDPKAIHKRFNDLYDAGNYPAALVEAQKLEAAVKARFGVSHPVYGGALAYLAIVYNKQGKYADAEDLYKRALAIFEKGRGTSQDVVARTRSRASVSLRTEQRTSFIMLRISTLPFKRG